MRRGARGRRSRPRGAGADNLIANALEHGGGQITIEGVRRGRRLELTVRDRGARRTPRLRRPEPRRGHGLRVTRSLARGNGGRLRVHALGQGTVAALELPLAARRERSFPPVHQRR